MGTGRGKTAGKIYTRISRQSLLASEATDVDFLRLAEGFASIPYTAILLSGGDGDCCRHSIIAAEPFLLFEAKGIKTSIRTSCGIEYSECDPLEALDGLFAERLRHEATPRFKPFSGGAVGYFAYELKNVIERLPQESVDDLGLPDIMLSFPGLIIIHDREEGTIRKICVESSRADGTILTPLPAGASGEDGGSWQAGPVESNFSREDYYAAVRRIRKHIAAGDVYQINLSQRLSFDFSGDPFALWTRLFEQNPAPFYAYINAGDHHVLSTSMERFVRRDGVELETRPIKGTRRRSANPIEDERLLSELVTSAKDDAELSMIVDLLRNDLGKLCIPGSVEVAEHKRIESYSNVHHLVSVVRGRLEPDTTNGRLIRALFPGGSITGCPKIRAMEIIDSLEPNVRHVYTGAIGYLGWHDNVDLSIAIRTAIVHGGKCHFGAGGGIVYDSREQNEYDETLDKAATLLGTIAAKESGRNEQTQD